MPMISTDWDELAELDPYWPVLGDRSWQGRRDDAEFFLTGLSQVDGVMAHAKELGLPKHQFRAMDFGCALGRLTRGLATHFSECYGVDVAAGMLAKAKELNRTVENCQFVWCREGNLAFLKDGSIDMIYSWGALQYCPDRAVMASCIRECVRVLSPGG